MRSAHTHAVVVRFLPITLSSPHSKGIVSRPLLRPPPPSPRMQKCIICKYVYIYRHANSMIVENLLVNVRMKNN